jgi:hypothetical protein
MPPRRSSVTEFLMRPVKGRFRANVTPEQRMEVEHRYRVAQASHPLSGARALLRLAGITTAVTRGWYGNSAWGWSLHGHRGGKVHRLHRYQRDARGRWLPYLALHENRQE